MNKTIKKLLKLLTQNSLVFILGGIAGFILMILLLEPLLALSIPKDVGLAVIALIPLFFILFTIVFVPVGGITAVLIYNFIKKKRIKNYF